MGILTPKVVTSGAPKPGGYLFWGPLTVALPTNESANLAAAFINLGVVSSDGLKVEDTAKSVDERDWAGDIYLSSMDEITKKYTFTLLSVLDPDVAKYRYGAANVTVTAASATGGRKIAAMDKGEKIEDGVYVFEMVNGSKRTREVVPYGSAMVSAVRDYQKARARGTEFTVTCYKDDAGVYRYIYSDDGIKTV